jgi:dimethylaniline monooxygenase (N-oxide forming)
MIQHEDFWDTIAKNVSVYRSDIRNMQTDSIILQDGSEVKSDVLFCGTGWSEHYPFLAKDQIMEFGLPHVPGDEEGEEDVKESARWESLLKAADQQVITQFPQLAHPPPHFKRPTKTTATRLYNCIAPLGDKTIAFLGDIYLSNSFRTAEAQAIWATAYFDGEVELPPREEAEKEITYMAAFSKRRYPSHGASGNYFHMDLVGYTDKLMQDVGLVSHRKGCWQDLVLPCLASDFKGIREEYLSKCGS